MRACKVDGNQAEIVKELRAVGAHVELLHTVGAGCPDLFVHYVDGDHEVKTLMEVKQPGEKLNDVQEAWHLAYFMKTGRKVPVVHSVDEALAAIGAPPRRFRGVL